MIMSSTGLIWIDLRSCGLNWTIVKNVYIYINKKLNTSWADQCYHMFEYLIKIEGLWLECWCWISPHNLSDWMIYKKCEIDIEMANG